jgi:exocyst complex component 6
MKRRTVRTVPHFSFRLPQMSVDMVLETLKVDFKPLYQSIHIYSTLDSLDELRKSYQADRKVRSSKAILYPLLTVQKAQSDLILPVPLQLQSLVPLTEQIIGFFIIESHILQTTGSFRSKAEVDELWDAIAARIAEAVDGALRNVTDPDSYLHVKETLIAFILTLEV